MTLQSFGFKINALLLENQQKERHTCGARAWRGALAQRTGCRGGAASPPPGTPPPSPTRGGCALRTEPGCGDFPLNAVHEHSQRLARRRQWETLRARQLQTCAHDPVHARLLNAALHVAQVLNVAICKHGDVYRLPAAGKNTIGNYMNLHRSNIKRNSIQSLEVNFLPHGLDVLPAGDASHGSFLLFGSAVHRQELSRDRTRPRLMTSPRGSSQFATAHGALGGTVVESHLAAGSLQHLSVADRLVHLGEHADLARDGHWEFFIGQLDCGKVGDRKEAQISQFINH